MSDKKFVTEEEFEKYKKEVDKRLNKKDRPPRPPREPNDYNLYMKEKLPVFKAENPKLSNTEVFEKVAKAWGKDKETWKRPVKVEVAETVGDFEEAKPVKKTTKKPVKVASPAED